MTGADRQWQLNRRNFEGRWCGASHWYLRASDGSLDLAQPSRVIAETCYAIRFFAADSGANNSSANSDVNSGTSSGTSSGAKSSSQGSNNAGNNDAKGTDVDSRDVGSRDAGSRDASGRDTNSRDADSLDADSGEWDGSGLLFAPEGRRRLALSRASYNRGGQCWQFEGAGGQSSLELDPQQPRWGHEVNLFHGRSRSMLVLLWGRQEGESGCRWRLEALGAVGFRCSLAPIPDPARPTPLEAASLLEGARGWPGVLETLVPGQWPREPLPPQPCGRFEPEDFALHPLTFSFTDALVCSVPEWLPQGPFTLQVGCQLAPDRFHQLSLQLDATGRLSRWELRRFTARDGS